MDTGLKPQKASGLSPARKTAYIGIIICSAFLIYLFGFRGMRFFLVPSGSMEPTLLPGDRLVTLNQTGYHPGEIVVLRDPEDTGSYVVKRIVALGGDTVSADGGALFINGGYASEPYLLEPINYELKPFTVAEDHVFVLGDNRNESEDSSLWATAVPGNDDPPPAGPRTGKSVPSETIIGRVSYIYYPPTRMGPLRPYPLTALKPD
ncbi:MAG: signal peptidase I [Candidatus Hydrogenedentes bacterium]|nr:signal peptidase I [Candidatus Hydrogenedentota bacterium]